MSDVYLVDNGAVCGLGHGLDDIWPRLLHGDSAIKSVESFDTDRLDVHQAACVCDLETKSSPNRVCALAKSALSQLGAIPDETFVIWAGVKGDAEYVEARITGVKTRVAGVKTRITGTKTRAAQNKTPEVFLPQHYRNWVCQFLGITNVGMEVNAACASSTAALALGAAMIAEGTCASVLVCAADVVSPFTFTGFAALKALSPTVCRPFDVRRDGLCLGDGAAAILMVNPSVVAEYKYTPVARLTGWGITNDAHHITGPARDGSGLLKAIGLALDQANLAPSDIEAWCTHGTGTIYNDAMELTAMDAVFGSRCFPIFSVKGALGHTLGAAGGLETVFGAQALQEKTVPPTAALGELEPRARGRASCDAQSFDGNNILTTNSGFGGVNAALILELAGDFSGANKPGGRS